MHQIDLITRGIIFTKIGYYWGLTDIRQSTISLAK